jgi:hypothetical protein
MPRRVGTYQLTVRYTDARGNAWEEGFRVEVVEVARVSVRVRCDDTQSHETHFIPAGEPIGFRVTAYDADERALDTGELTFVEEFDSFEATDDPFVREAPSEVGRYVWELGGLGEDVVFEVYDPAGIELQMEERITDDTVMTALELFVRAEDAAVCRGPSPITVQLEVLQGECRPVRGGVEFEGGVVLEAAPGSTVVSLAGEGACSVRATLSTGASAEREFEVRTPELAELAPLELVFQTERQGLPSVFPNPDAAVLGDCPNLEPRSSDGECPGFDFGDPDCTKNQSWWSSHEEPGVGPLEAPVLGVGLKTELRLALQLRTLDLFVAESYPPTGLTMELRPAQGLSLVDLGCTETERRFELAPRVSGDHILTLTATNAPDLSYTTNYLARDIARTVLRPVDLTGAVATAPATNSRETEEGSTRHMFVRAEETLHLDYLDVIDQPLRGHGDVEVASENASGSASVVAELPRTWKLRAGTDRDTIVLETPVRGGRHVIVVEDASGIRDIGGLSPLDVELGESACVRPVPLTEGLVPINGRSPARPRVSGHGAQWIVSTVDTPEPSVCFRAAAPGAAELRWTWGEAEKLVAGVVE